MNSIEFGLKKGHSTGLNDLLCTEIKLFIYCYHIIDHETPLTLILFMLLNFSLEFQHRISA